ncbi:hypothetical protein POM88_004431 [Heracleum sosnowskyi]|uniref:Uncharacterized protein n=1 Tax=Heracleum sosnowskyi TaxID=360622 RepID=A0AAD8JJH1_9APIA|nr:hypothetical protein POM88_004431 [Heracleum sosnowskyi]
MATLSMLIGPQTHPSLHIRATSLDLPLPDSRTTSKSKDKGEIISADKMQVYEGLDIAANKITEEEMNGVPHHHLIGILPSHADFTYTDFCCMVNEKMDDIVARKRLPIIVGCSNSYIKALVDDEVYNFRPKYECHYLWVDVAISVLCQVSSDRVDQMVEKGLIDEDEETRAKLLKKALDEMRINSCKIARRQVEKILALKNDEGWNIHRLDGTNVFSKHGRKSSNA